MISGQTLLNYHCISLRTFLKSVQVDLKDKYAQVNICISSEKLLLYSLNITKIKNNHISGRFVSF